LRGFVSGFIISIWIKIVKLKEQEVWKFYGTTQKERGEIGEVSQPGPEEARRNGEFCDFLWIHTNATGKNLASTEKFCHTGSKLVKNAEKSKSL